MARSNKRSYSVFLGNVGSCSDRYCAAYAPPFSIEQLFERAASIELLSGVDLVATRDILAGRDTVKRCLDTTGLRPVSVAVDHFTEAIWRQGSFSSIDPAIRAKAVQATCEVMDFAKDLGCDLVTIWPGQDGYDYPLQADYEQERTWFADGIRQAAAYRRDVRVSIEYKLKEPRTHCYLNGASTAALILAEIGAPNCGAVLDYGHALLGQENPAESVVILKRHGNRLMHVHINDNFRSWDDDLIVGSIHQLELLEFVYWLRRTQYKGWITMDQFPYRDDGRDSVAESVAWLDAIETVLDRADPKEIAHVLRQKDSIASNRLARRLLLGV